MNFINVMHVTDTLDAGGAEKIAVSLANLLPRHRYRSHLCTTRREGVLVDQLTNDVLRLRLSRRQRLDLGALHRLCKYLAQHEVDIIHAHGTSLFISAIASLFPPYPALVWHDHYGRYKFDDRPVWLYRLAAARVSRVIAVNEPLVQWSRSRLGVRSDHVEYIPNFVCEGETVAEVSCLPGHSGFRIVCVANLRPEKDHSTLLQALDIVVRKCPLAHLLLIGAEGDSSYASRIQREIDERGLTGHVSFLGMRRDVPSILKLCEVGVLSSASEGLPLALLEYATAGLASVCTEVGQCSEVLEEGKCGLLVPPNSPQFLATALLSLLDSAQLRTDLGAKAKQRVRQHYSPSAAVRQICSIYESIIRSKSPAGDAAFA